MTFKRMMVLGAAAAALVFTGCQDRSRAQEERTPAADQTQPATGGSGLVNDQGTPGAVDSNAPSTSGSLDQNNTGTSGALDQNTGSLNDQSGIGGSGTKTGTKKPMGAKDGGTPGSDGGM